MEVALLVIGVILALVGVAGAVLPGLPGPPISFVGLLCVHFSPATSEIHWSVLLFTGVLTLISLLVDYLLPLLGTKKFGGSKYGVMGAIAGLLVGVFFFPPFGIILGPLIGAIAGEMLANKETNEAIMAGVGAFVGFMVSIVSKLVICGIIGFFIFKNLI